MKIYTVLYSLILHLFISQVISAQTPERISFKELFNQDSIHVLITGAYNRIENEVFQDFNGVYYGKSVLLQITNQNSTDYFLHEGLGCMLISMDTSVQDMIITKDIICPIPKKKTITTKIYAMCAEYHDAMPNLSTSYTLGEVINEELLRVAATISDEKLQNIIGQSAIWILTDNADFSMLQKYGATMKDFERAKNIIDDSRAISTKAEGSLQFNDFKFKILISILALGIVLIFIFRRYKAR